MKQKDIYFERLSEIIKNSYTPYSKFKVACLVLAEDRLFPGVNVENCSYPLTICAERSAISAMVTAGFKKISCIYLLAKAPENKFTTPCGACRQVINEFSTPDTKIVVYKLDGKKNEYTLGQLLPFNFSRDFIS